MRNVRGWRFAIASNGYRGFEEGEMESMEQWRLTAPCDIGKLNEDIEALTGTVAVGEWGSSEGEDGFARKYVNGERVVAW
jgi:hypothetical protein